MGRRANAIEVDVTEGAIRVRQRGRTLTIPIAPPDQDSPDDADFLVRLDDIERWDAPDDETPIEIEELPAEQLLLSDVENVFFLYHDGTDWQETWDSTADQTRKLPRAIKVQIQLAGASPAELRPPVELVVPIVVEATTNSVSGGSQ